MAPNTPVPREESAHDTAEGAVVALFDTLDADG